MADDFLQIDLGQRIGFEVTVHPLVPLQILDLYVRKFGTAQSSEERDQVRVAGTLMGIVYTNRVHITSCYAVTGEEEQNVYNLDFQEHKQLFDLHVVNNPQEVLLGGFITGDQELDISVAYLSQEYGKKENNFISTALLPSPVILKVDPSIKDGKIGLRAFRLNQSLRDYCGVASFNVLPIKVEFLDETITQVTPFLERDDGRPNFLFNPVEQDSVQNTLAQATRNITSLEQYVQAVIDGKQEGNKELGRQLLHFLNTSQSYQSSDFLREYQALNQEAQIIQYLSNLALGQSIIGEKLAKV